jgi:hypothetical protein
MGRIFENNVAAICWGVVLGVVGAVIVVLAIIY